MNIQTLKGFRDFLPVEARKRQYVIGVLRRVFEKYGFEPLETPALEYEEILTGKYGEEGDKLMYRFEDNGKRRVAMRYDQTVPLSRVVAQYSRTMSENGTPLLPLPFKRYQIQPVWRAENTQKGRFREFTQCDIDTTGVNSALADAEILATVIESFQELGFENFKILINDRENLKFSDDKGELDPDTNIKAIRSLDKLKKIGRDGVIEDLKNNGFTEQVAKIILETSETIRPTQRINEVLDILEKFEIDKKYIEFSGTLARGLDYYTGIIFETEIEEYTAGAVCSGGRYDKLIGMFLGSDVPAIGCAFGFDRIIDAMNELKLFPDKSQNKSQVLVTIFSPEMTTASVKINTILRKNGIKSELWLDPNSKMDKQLKFADQKNIPYVVILGPNEAKENVVMLKNLKTREQKKVTLEQIAAELK